MLKFDRLMAKGIMENEKKEIRVRFAPSPTGLLHAGNVRVALFNYLFVRKFGGKFILRIDDTDQERSTKESEALILEDLAWLGIKYDEFYRQSERINKYAEIFERLKAEGRVYPCYETKEELALKRKTQTMSGIPPVYDRGALKLTDEQRKKLEESGMKPYWRFKLDDSTTAEWNDLVHGEIRIPLNTVSDPVVVKPDGGFVYTFASVVDDADLGITHIIRGDDHVTNTAVQIDIFKAICSGSYPSFAHLPLMSSMDGQEVSKRTGSALSVVNMRGDGIFPEALINLLANLGTANNIDYRDTFESLIKKFDFKKMSLASPKFNIEDVRIINKKILVEKKFDEVKTKLQASLKNFADDKKMHALWDTVKGNINKLSEVSFWDDVFHGKIKISSEKLDDTFLKQMLDTLSNSVDFDQWVSKLKEISGKKGRELFHPIRIALTDLENGPELKKIVQFLGRDAIKERIKKHMNINKDENGRD